MQLCRFTSGADARPRFGAIVGETVGDLGGVGGLASLDEALRLPLAGLRATLEGLDPDTLPGAPLADCALRAPIGGQEVWACGVTYERSREARMHESRERDVYDRVYDAERPEIFFKATPSRVVGPGAAVVIRQDSTWDVPEPELALVLNSRSEIAG